MWDKIRLMHAQHNLPLSWTYARAWLLLLFTLLLTGCATSRDILPSAKYTYIPKPSRPPVLDFAAYTVELTTLCPSESKGGSGVLISPQGDLLTAYHVVAHAARERGCKILVGKSKKINSPPTRLYRATLIAYDAPMDLAILRITGDKNGLPVKTPFPAAPLAPEMPLIGETIHVLGYPELTDEMLAYDKDTIIAVGECDSPESCWILTEAFASWGSSGGPAFNDQGQLVGITTGEEENTWKGRTHRLVAIRPIPPFKDFIAKALASPSTQQTTASPPASIRMDEWQVKIVGPLGVNWRTEPSTARGQTTVIRLLPTGSTLHVIPPGKWQGWWATVDDKGHMGWVKERTAHLTLVESRIRPVPSLLRQGQTAVITCLTLRPCASLIYTPGYEGDEIIGHLAGGTRVEVVEGPLWVEHMTWWRVRYDGGEGWLSEIDKNNYRLLSPSGP